LTADADSEILAGNVFDLVGFVEDHGGVFRNDSAEVFMFNGQVSEEEVMIDDDNVAFVRALVHCGDEAALELLALLAGAKVATCIDLVPGGTVLWQGLDFRAVASRGLRFPSLDDLEICH